MGMYAKVETVTRMNLQRLFWPHGLGHAVEIRCCSEAKLQKNPVVDPQGRCKTVGDKSERRNQNSKSLVRFLQSDRQRGLGYESQECLR